MSKFIKKFLSVLTVCILVLGLFSLNVSALSGSTSIEVSNNNPKVGSTLIVTCSFSLSDDACASGELHYESSKLKYITSTSPGDATNKTADGNVIFVTDRREESHYFRVEFEVIAEGDTTLQLTECVASDITEASVSGYSKTIKLGSKPSSSDSTSSQDTTKNTNAALSSLSVTGGTLTPAFKENITEYTVVVPYSHTDGILSCNTVDPNAKTKVEGDRELKVGLNTRTIIVTSSNGEVRRYSVTFNRLDENGNDTTATTDETLLATVNGKEFKISQADADVTAPLGFTLTTTTYKGQEIAAYADDSGKTVIVYLVASDDSEKGFYLLENDTFKAFNYIECNDKLYIVTEGDVAPDGMFKSQCEIGGNNVPCYKYTAEEYADYVIVFAKTSDGEEGYYRYDIKEGTLQRYPEFKSATTTVVDDKVKVPSSKKIAIIALSAVFVLGFLAIIVLVVVKICINVKKKKTEQEYFNDFEE